MLLLCASAGFNLTTEAPMGRPSAQLRSAGSADQASAHSCRLRICAWRVATGVASCWTARGVQCCLLQQARSHQLCAALLQSTMLHTFMQPRLPFLSSTEGKPFLSRGAVCACWHALLFMPTFAALAFASNCPAAVMVRAVVV